MRGRVVPLSKPRRVVADLMHFAAGVPSVPVQRRMGLAAVAAARATNPVRPPWTAIFVKAYALVAREVPELRRAYCKFPVPHLYEYDRSAGCVAFEKDYRGEPGVFGVPVRGPDEHTLVELAGLIRHLSKTPAEELRSMRRMLAFAGLPRVVRRALWWVALNLGRQRFKYFGTFALSVYSGLGAESLHQLGPWPTMLNYGVMQPDGTVDVRVVYDHRVMDGATVARALRRLEEVLTGPITDELREVWLPDYAVADETRRAALIPPSLNAG
jgi:hypothetical protein